MPSCSKPASERRRDGTTSPADGEVTKGPPPIRRPAAGTWQDTATDFDWRLSIADVQPGPFSVLAGVDRIFTLTDGPAVVLSMDGREHEIMPQRPYRFRGDASTACLTAYPATALNVMARRATTSASVGVRRGSGMIATPLRCVTFVVVLHGSASVRCVDRRGAELQRLDAVHLHTAATIKTGRGDRVAVVRMRPRP